MQDSKQNLYLGSKFSSSNEIEREKEIHLKSKDLLTHGVVLGMTGSGKTGLCLSLLEELSLDGVPSLLLDPKGDIGNLALQLGDFDQESFRPWVNEQEAQQKALSVDEMATKEAEKWKQGLADWGVAPERVKALRDKMDLRIYSPGASFGLSISLLSNFAKPDLPEDMWPKLAEAKISSLLALMGEEEIDSQGSDYIFLCHVLLKKWGAGENLDLSTLVAECLKPSFEKLGALSVDEYISSRKRKALANSINGLIASPRFSRWINGETFDFDKRLAVDGDTVPVNIFYLAHLNDQERMFFVTWLLGELMTWMRRQQGSKLLRAVLYMDEIFGFLPPVKNPPSKEPFLLLLKQARAYGLSLLLATQNPVDLDYRALSNVGIWLLGRLQTERDKSKVLEGLKTLEGSNDSLDLDQVLSQLKSRCFVLKNVHRDPVELFHTRWAMSYLSGPLTQKQVDSLMKDKKSEQLSSKPVAAVKAPAEAKIVYQGEQYFYPCATKADEDQVVYVPAVMCQYKVKYALPTKKRKSETTEAIAVARIRRDKVDWQELTTASESLANICREPDGGYTKSELSDSVHKKDFMLLEADEAKNSLSQAGANVVYKIRQAEMFSDYGETKDAFLNRMQSQWSSLKADLIEASSEDLEKEIAKLEKSVDKKARQLEKEKNQSKSAKISAAFSLGSAVLGFLSGSKRSATSMRRGATAGRSATRAWKEGQDVKVIAEELQDMEAQLQTLKSSKDELLKSFDALAEADILEQKLDFEKENLKVLKMALLWLPYKKISDFELEKAF